MFFINLDLIIIFHLYLFRGEGWLLLDMEALVVYIFKPLPGSMKFFIGIYEK